jgi:hypothetical protein
MSKRNSRELATARRKLRQIEDQESAFCIRIASMPQAEQRRVKQYFCDLQERQRREVERLEAELNQRSLPTSLLIDL